MMERGRREGSPVQSGAVLVAAAVVVVACSWGWRRDAMPPSPSAARCAAVEAYIGGLERMAVALEAVVDDESADQAASVIRQVARRMAQSRQRIGRFGGRRSDPIVLRYGDRLAAASENLRRETGRIGEEPRLVRRVQLALAAVPPLT